MNFITFNICITQFLSRASGKMDLVIRTCISRYKRLNKLNLAFFIFYRIFAITFLPFQTKVTEIKRVTNSPNVLRWLPL